MTKCTALARIPIGQDELVISLATSGIRLASANGLTIPLTEISKLIAALECAVREAAE
jgi:hypothetical protein